MLNKLKGLFIGLFLISLFAIPLKANAANKIKEGSVAVIEYTLKADDKLVTKDEDMKVVVGSNSFPPAYEKQLLGLKEGDKKIIKLKPEDAFGQERQELVKRVPKSQIPTNVQMVEGQLIGGRKGQRAMRVVKVLDDSVILDQNHPLAGKTLIYNIRVKSIN